MEEARGSKDNILPIPKSSPLLTHAQQKNKIDKCLGKSLYLSTIHLLLAKLLHHFYQVEHEEHPGDMSKVLMLSYKMMQPLHAIFILKVDLKKL